MKNRKIITVFEHQSLKAGQKINGESFSHDQLKSFQNFYGEKGVPYFTLIHNGIKFNEYVGVIQVGDTVIEVLPKTDKSNDANEWRKMLIQMLKVVVVFDIHAPTTSQLNLKSNSILDLYFEMFIQNVEYLLHSGLVKKYKKVEGNSTALKGAIVFPKHIRQNITHQERFYIRSTVYNVEFDLHKILYKTIILISKINTNPELQSRIGELLLNFPEMPDIKVTENTFTKIHYDRKTLSYQGAIDIAKLLLLQYHPNISTSRNNVLALMFDMNLLWEKFVYVSLKKHKDSPTIITAQNSKRFWQSKTGNKSTIRPDIVINNNQQQCLVLDTKWKNLNGKNPSLEDLRQMYVYHEYFNATQVGLIYPDSKTSISSGRYLDPKTGTESDRKCKVILLAIESDIKLWQKNIHDVVEGMLIQS